MSTTAPREPLRDYWWERESDDADWEDDEPVDIYGNTEDENEDR